MRCSHERSDQDQDPLAVPVQPICPIEIEDLASDDSSLIHEGQPWKDCPLVRSDQAASVMKAET
jgi:hypothetical protein